MMMQAPPGVGGRSRVRLRKRAEELKPEDFKGEGQRAAIEQTKDIIKRTERLEERAEEAAQKAKKARRTWAEDLAALEALIDGSKR